MTKNSVNYNHCQVFVFLGILDSSFSSPGVLGVCLVVMMLKVMARAIQTMKKLSTHHVNSSCGTPQ